jgi:uncharacterized protein
MPDAAADVVRDRYRSRVAGFCRFLRGRGFPAGTAAELDLARALDAVDVLDPDQFRAACAVALARSPEEIAFVTTALAAYFGAGADPGRLHPAAEDVAGVPPRPRPARNRARAARGGELPDRSPPVAVPLGTYSASAPGAGHPIGPLADREVRAMRRGARRFGRAVATLPGRRHERARRGPVDLRATMRRGLWTSGEWFELRRQRPRPSRPELAILWDVSGSMREHESRLFALVHALARASRRARVFAFSTEVEEITAELRRGSYRRVAARVGRRIERADGGTRIGRSIGEFADRFGAALRDRTTLVVVSDGWDLGDADAVGAELARLAPRVHRVVWVTPYTRRPGFEPRVGGLASALDAIDALTGPEDFESRWPLRPFPLPRGTRAER